MFLDPRDPFPQTSTALVLVVLILMTGATLVLVSDADRLAALLACIALAVVLGVRAR